MKPVERFDDYVVEHLASQLIAKLENDFPDMQGQRCIQVKENGKEYEGINLLGEGSGVSPTIYLTDAAMQIRQEGVSVPDAVEKLHSVFMEKYYLRPSVEAVLAKLRPDNLYVSVLNKLWNAEKISTGPYQDIAGTDLVFVAKLRIADNASIYVTDAVCSQLGLTGTEVMSIARTNSLEQENWVVKDMKEVIFGNIDLTELPEEVREEIILQQEDCMPMVVISNEQMTSAAGIFLDRSTRKHVSERLGLEECESFYILPSSLYECIAIPSEGMLYEEALEMVQQVNLNEVQTTEQLSDNVYICDAKTLDIKMGGTIFECDFPSIEHKRSMAM